MKRRTLLVLAALAAVPLALAAQSAGEYVIGCDGGDLLSCTVVGLIYETGAVGTRDFDRATTLYERACRREVRSACQRLEIIRDPESAPMPTDELIRVGHVADAYDGTPIAGAIVRLRGIPGVGERRYLTDETGRVVLDPLPRGSHPIEVRRGGYTPTAGDLPVPWNGDFLMLMERVAEPEEEEVSTVGTVFGQITEAGSTVGISAVDVVVTGGAEVRTLTDARGRFQLTALEPGIVTVELRRLGYEPRTATVTVVAGRVTEVVADLSQEPIALAPIEVTIASGYLERTGFFRRAITATGDRFTHRDIERLNPVLVADLLRRVGGVTVASGELGRGSEAISNRRRGGSELGACRLQPYVDGILAANFDVEVVRPEDIEALEVYQGANVPIQYNEPIRSDGATCGVVLIWTRDPRRRD
jgi:hypothetical protein